MRQGDDSVVIRLVHISRLIESLHLGTPAGIDRVEMAYVRHFLSRADRDDVRFVVTWPHFTGVLPHAYVKPLVEATALRWAIGSDDPCPDQTMAQLRDIMREPLGQTIASAPGKIGLIETRRQAPILAQLISIMVKSHASPLSRMLRELREKGAWYVQVSPFLLSRPDRFTWIKKANVRSLFMLHDLIPLEYPEYFPPGQAARHKARVDTIVEHASVIVANSDYTRRSLKKYVAQTPPVEVLPLGVSSDLSEQRNIEPFATSVPYFVVIGTIEPRKNLEFLLTLWRRWTDDGRAYRARLVVVGRRGWELENIANLLDRSATLAPTVIEVGSLSDAGLTALLKGATALLAASRVEGFGLPVAEALALGVPVIASDIDAHREVAGPFAEYISPIDGPGWMQALTDYSEPNSQRRQSHVAALKDYRVPTWADHMRRVEELLAER